MPPFHMNRLPKSISQLLWSSFVATYGPVLAFLGLAISVAAWFVSGGAQVSVAWLVAVATASAIIIGCLMEAMLVAFRAAGRGLPGVRYVSSPPSAFDSLSAILLLDPSDLFAPDAAVSVYQLREQEYEVLIGVGRVLTVQQNGLIQIGLTPVGECGPDFMARLLANDISVLRSLVVKPTVPTFVVQQWE